MPQISPRYQHSRYQHEDTADIFMTEHDLAVQLPPDTTAISSSGYMDNHRKPIISINGKDVPEHEGSA